MIVLKPPEKNDYHIGFDCLFCGGVTVPGGWFIEGAGVGGIAIVSFSALTI